VVMSLIIEPLVWKHSRLSDPAPMSHLAVAFHLAICLQVLLRPVSRYGWCVRTDARPLQPRSHYEPAQRQEAAVQHHPSAAVRARDGIGGGDRVTPARRQICAATRSGGSRERKGLETMRGRSGGACLRAHAVLLKLIWYAVSPAENGGSGGG